MATLYLCVVCLALIYSVVCQLDTKVCSPSIPGKNEPKKPTLPQYFEMHVEANIINRKYTSDYHLWYDQAGQRMAVHVENAGLKTQSIFSFSTNEIFNIDEQTNRCTVGAISSDPFRDHVSTVSNDGVATMFTPAQLLHFGGNVPEVWVNQTAVRGVMCNMWRSCQYWPSRNATMVVDHYFSVPTWKTSTLNPSVPVAIHVTGNVWTNGKSRVMNHMYDILDFITVQRELTHFETPPHVYCPKRKNTMDLPKPASAFHFTAEILDVDSQVISFIKEYYNYDQGLVRYDYTPTEPYPYGKNLLTQVHDFNTGVAYIIDNIRGNCTTTPISAAGFDTRNADPTHARIRTTQEFFDLDKTNYTYEGTRAARDILTNVWISQRTDWPKPNSPVSTWEWYFATSDFTANLPDQLQFGMPVMLTMTAGLGQSYIYNIYDYDEQRPAIWSYDISKCFSYTQKRDFSFKLPGSFRSAASSNNEKFRYAVINAITKAGSSATVNLSPLRINNIQVDYADNNDIVLQFTLLDRAPKIGDVVNPKLEQDLNTVANLIVQAINSGKFIVKMMVSGQAVMMPARPYSLTPTQNIVKHSYYTATQKGSTTSTGTSGGAMAGMGVAMLVVFFILAVLGTYMFYRRQGGAFVAKRFDNTDITQDDS